MKALQTLIVGFILVAVFAACHKDEHTYQSTGTITGPDYRECICCGGYFIEMNDSTYNFETLPDGTDIDLNTAEFPVPVKLDWSYDRKCGDIQYISISRIEKL